MIIKITKKQILDRIIKKVAAQQKLEAEGTGIEKQSRIVSRIRRSLDPQNLNIKK